jgi:O-acetyl-ADP-ribose deacetylase (regulator of RNase III)
VIEVIRGRLVDQPVAALLLSANNRLANRTGRSLDVEHAAGPTYAAECRDRAAGGSEGLPLGSAVVTGGGQLAAGSYRRWILQAITIGDRSDNSRIPATPGIVYSATRAALEKAELFRIDTVATYLMAQRPGYATRPPDEMAEALCRALRDHAAVAVSLTRILLCEEDATAVARATQALDRTRAGRA